MGDPVREVFVGLGSNIDPEANLVRARESIAARVGRIVARSRVYRTEAIGRAQADFLNQVIEVEVDAPERVGPRRLLALLLDIEVALGRPAVHETWGPRTIDLDLHAYRRALRDEPGLVVPHPRIVERRFVLEPWADIAPGFVVPGLDATVSELRDGMRDAVGQRVEVVMRKGGQ
ncbi:MAG: 2-amino-4-hydroxy-6-hydroxymethyldihydropteridine diphosphokinase [Planctomycetes bacterium]|nr:2-amino-4-hydroxy-6-hydroxymethyldihydropteridine diphosphokinase [Planctomycetota bacterium]